MTPDSVQNFEGIFCEICQGLAKKSLGEFSPTAHALPPFR